MSNLKFKKIYILLVVFVLFSAFLPFISLAQEGGIEYTPITVSGVPGVIGPGEETRIEPFLTNIFTFLIGIAAVLAIIQITLGGVQYMTSNAVGSIEDAKDKIRQAIIGLLLILGTYIILQQINPALVNINLTVPS
jgi:hypothetical protein